LRDTTAAGTGFRRIGGTAAIPCGALPFDSELAMGNPVDRTPAQWSELIRTDPSKAATDMDADAARTVPAGTNSAS